LVVTALVYLFLKSCKHSCIHLEALSLILIGSSYWSFLIYCIRIECPDLFFERPYLETIMGQTPPGMLMSASCSSDTRMQDTMIRTQLHLVFDTMGHVICFEVTDCAPEGLSIRDSSFVCEDQETMLGPGPDTRPDTSLELYKNLV
jgi:hypothetical protein